MCSANFGLDEGALSCPQEQDFLRSLFQVEFLSFGLISKLHHSSVSCSRSGSLPYSLLIVLLQDHRPQLKEIGLGTNKYFTQLPGRIQLRGIRVFQIDALHTAYQLLRAIQDKKRTDK